ncbi:serine hydrolase domain-containing protein [Chryseobacterium paludis]|uniref:serine hydrolase domain-containing protein n=1 Tax=Chryseobacterium paludis TaxID=2956784 RepID=UPI0021BEF02D|nr:serine hydrolase domain-containing protein [Chryseobacterium paludis]
MEKVTQSIHYQYFNNKFIKYAVFLLSIAAVKTICAQKQTSAELFSAKLDSIRIQLKIPGMAAAVQQGNAILLEQGYGYADMEQNIPATPQTSFRVASVTKTFTSTLLMELVEQHKLNLDDPVTQYGIDLGNSKITVRHLLTHTSEGIPGTYFQYNGYRYGLLGKVIEKASGKPFYSLLMERIIIPLKMTSSAPAIALDQFYDYSKLNPSVLPFFDTTFNRLAKPYEVDNSGHAIHSEYLNEFGAFGGLATSVSDILKYSDAIDHNQFISAASQKEVYTAHKTNNGIATPYGLGWFVQSYKGVDYYWHYGQSTGESALFVKIPSIHLTLIVMCNMDQLSQPFPLGDGDLLMSPVGQLLYLCFINNNEKAENDLENKELITNATMALKKGDTLKAQRLYNVYQKKYDAKENHIPNGKIIADIRNVGVNKDINRTFKLLHATSIKVYAVGENCSGDGSSWCDYGWIDNNAGQTVWRMQGKPSTSAGGAFKNQKVCEEIILPRGQYTLHYKSDSGHAYNYWDSLPPDHFFWGILLLKDSK